MHYFPPFHGGNTGSIPVGDANHFMIKQPPDGGFLMPVFCSCEGQSRSGSDARHRSCLINLANPADVLPHYFHM